MRASAFLQTGGTLQVLAERQDNFRKNDDVRWQSSGARPIAKGNPLNKQSSTNRKTSEQIAAAGLPKPDISIMSDQFLAEVLA